MPTENDVVQLLSDLLQGEEPSLELPPGGVSVRTFEDAMLMTSDSGLVIRIGEQTFQLTVRARHD